MARHTFYWDFHNSWQLKKGHWKYEYYYGGKWPRFYFDEEGAMCAVVSGKGDIYLESAHFADCKSYQEKVAKAQHIVEAVDRLERMRRGK